jgi:hypothetical protein
MKEKKFPVLPVAVLGIAIIGGGALAFNKPLVGTPDEINNELMKREQERIAKDTKVQGEARETTKNLEDEMKNLVKDTKSSQEAPKASLIKTGAPPKPQKQQKSDSNIQGQWYREQAGK